MMEEQVKGKRHRNLIVAVLLGIAMLTLAGCQMPGRNSQKPEDQIVGEWHASAWNGKDAETYTAEQGGDPKDLQTNYIFEQDGTGHMESALLTLVGEKGEFKWKYEDGKVIMLVKGQELTLKYDGEKLIGTSASGVETTIVRGRVDISATEKPSGGFGKKSDGEDVVGLVKNSCPSDYPNVTYGEAFEDFFAEPTWKDFVSDENEQIVEFHGKCDYYGKTQDACIQFTVTDENFKCNYVSIGDEKMSETESSEIFNKIFSSYGMEDSEDSEETTESDSDSGEDGDYIIADSDSRYLEEEEINELTAEEKRLARNEIYARHGYIFKDQELADYFMGKTWYAPIIEADDFNDVEELNKYERANIKKIKKLE